MTDMSKFIKKHMKWLVAATAVTLSLAMVLGTATSVLAAPYDLTTDNPIMTYTINGAIWERFQPTDATGSGTFHSFLRVQQTGIERGYNTDYRPLQFDENSSPTFTKSMLLNDVPQVDIGGTIYREFQLDINETDSTPNWYISLDRFQVWVTNNPSITGYDEASHTFTTGAALVYDLGDNSIKLDYRANAGSGKRDYRVFIPESAFPSGYTNVVLFTQHGATFSTDDGFEEWGVAVYNATKSGTKFNDLNNNGQKDTGEPHLQGWTINLSGPNGLNLTTVTDVNGNYSFSVPAGGPYTVSEVQQAGWVQSYPLAPNYYEVTLGNGELDTDNDFGNYQTATKSGVKFEDLNANGVDDTEPGLSDWVIRAYADNNTANGVLDQAEYTAGPVASDTTDVNGEYSLTLDPGDYIIVEVLQAGWTQSFPTSDVVTATGTNLGEYGYAITLTSGELDEDNDFGNWNLPPPPPAVGGEVYPVNKVSLLAPWLGLILILAIGGGIFALRRRRAH